MIGSHKLGDLGLIENGKFGRLRGFERAKNAESFAGLPTRIFDADAGDVMIWSSLTVHGSEANYSDQHRMYYMNGVAAAACSRPWPNYLERGRIAELDPSLIP